MGTLCFSHMSRRSSFHPPESAEHILQLLSVEVQVLWQLWIEQFAGYLCHGTAAVCSRSALLPFCCSWMEGNCSMGGQNGCSQLLRSTGYFMAVATYISTYTDQWTGIMVESILFCLAAHHVFLSFLHFLPTHYGNLFGRQLTGHGWHVDFWFLPVFLSSCISYGGGAQQPLHSEVTLAAGGHELPCTHSLHGAWVSRCKLLCISAASWAGVVLVTAPVVTSVSFLLCEWS